MAKSDITRNKIKSKISAIKRIAEEPNSFDNSIYENFKGDLDDNSGVIQKNINDFRSKIKGATKNQKDIFSEILDLSDVILDDDEKVNPNEKPIVKKKLLRYTKDAARSTLRQTKQILVNELKNTIFGGVNVCDPSNTLNTVSVSLSPKSFDFLNMLRVNPSTVSGKLMYERDEVNPSNNIKFNKILFESFDDPSTYDFVTKNGETLFTLNWDAVNQEYDVTNISPTLNVGEFFDKYYDSVESPNIDDIYKTSMEMLLGGGEEDPLFEESKEKLNRLLDKLFSLCGNSKNQNPLRKNTTTMVTEDEYDTINYFDFDGTEGIDIDVDTRKNGVLRFRDCNNFEIPINSNYTEDFAYHLGKKTIDENVDNTINKMATEAFDSSDGSVYIDLYIKSLSTDFIRFIPRAIISNIMSPKMLFPVVLAYKSTVETTELTAEQIIKNLHTLFFNVIRGHLWTFITEFWGYLKKDVMKFVRDVATKILLNKVKKIKSVVGVLIALITRIVEEDIQSCDEIFNTMLQTISTALNRNVKVPIPGLLLVMSDSLPGYSNERAYMNIIERLESNGIDTGPIYGTDNKLPTMIKSIIDGHSEEMDTNSFVKIALKPTIIPAGPGGAVISPLIVGSGKMF